MSVNEREDIVQLNELGKLVDIEKLEFNQLMSLLTGFVQSQLLSDRSGADLGIDQDTLRQARTLMASAEKLLAGEISPGQAEDPRVQAWEEFDRRDDSDIGKGLMRVVVCCLYDRESAEFDTYGSSAILETFLSSLLDMGPKYCKLFGPYAERFFRKKLD